MALQTLDAVGNDLRRWASGDQPRVPTGFPHIDTLTHGGIASGEVAVAFARTGVGKTWFALNVVKNNPTTPTVFFSLEMHGRYILSRLAAIDNRVPTRTIEANLARYGGDENLDRTVSSFQALRIDDETGLSFDDMLLQLERYADEEGERPQLVVVDFLGLVSSFSMDNVVKSLAVEAKAFARNGNVALLVLHQANRGSGDKKNLGHLPLSMVDMEYGGEQLADYIIGMYRPSLDPKMPPINREASKGDFYIQLLKSRSGAGLDEAGTVHFLEQDTGLIVPVPNHWS